MKIEPVKPRDGQESVWDYPRPPRLEPFSGHLRVIAGERVICDSRSAVRMLETSHPPVYYIPIVDFIAGSLQKTGRSSFCEFKGKAHYYDLVLPNKKMISVGWGYEKPAANYADLVGKIAVYAHKVDQCLVNDELVEAQPGDFYGGWITKNVVGPFKGQKGSWGW